jgi:hypothetical protein
LPHGVPHAEQLFGSLVVSVHCCPHGTWPMGQVPVQAPEEQTSPDLHAFPHAPQFKGSDPSVTHALPQAT